MMALGYFLKAVADVLNWVLVIYMWLIIARAILSWVTEPVLSYLRRRLPLVYGGLDLSPLLVLGAIIFLKVFLVGTLYGYAAKLIHGYYG